MKNLIITAVGSDRLGIVSELTKIITNHGGNIEESRMTRLGADFTIIMLVTIDSKYKESLIMDLQAIEELSITTKTTKSKNDITGESYQISLKGADNEGIVQVISEYLAGRSINIVEMETYISNAPITGTPLFNLMTITTISEKINLTKIQSDLNLISQKLGVEINVKQSKYTPETV